MESDQRHDLRENDLQEFLGNFGEFWDRWGNTILLGLTIAIVIFAGLRLYWSSQRQAHQSALNDLAATQKPGDYVKVAQKHDMMSVKAIAQLRAGDLFLAEAGSEAEAHNEPNSDQGGKNTASANDQANEAEDGQSTSKPKGPSADKGSQSASTPNAGAQNAKQQAAKNRSRKQSLTYAAKSYQDVINLDTPPIYAINAYFGLAAVAESRHNLDQARRQYEKVMDLATPNYPASVAQAKSRMQMLSRLKHPTPFGTEPPPSASRLKMPGQAGPRIPPQAGSRLWPWASSTK